MWDLAMVSSKLDTWKVGVYVISQVLGLKISPQNCLFYLCLHLLAYYLDFFLTALIHNLPVRRMAFTTSELSFHDSEELRKPTHDRANTSVVSQQYGCLSKTSIIGSSNWDATEDSASIKWSKLDEELQVVSDCWGGVFILGQIPIPLSNPVWSALELVCMRKSKQTQQVKHVWAHRMPKEEIVILGKDAWNK